MGTQYIRATGLSVVGNIDIVLLPLLFTMNSIIAKKTRSPVDAEECAQ